MLFRSLFWCYFIIKHGDIKYETINNKNIVITKQLKIELISKIRENKLTVKTYKFDTISNIESNLANDNNINIKTIMTLCAIDNINIIFISKKTYFELEINSSIAIEASQVFELSLKRAIAVSFVGQYGAAETRCYFQTGLRQDQIT